MASKEEEILDALSYTANPDNKGTEMYQRVSPGGGQFDRYTANPDNKGTEMLG